MEAQSGIRSKLRCPGCTFEGGLSSDKDQRPLTGHICARNVCSSCECFGVATTVDPVLHRRAFMSLMGCATVLPRKVCAQPQSRTVRIGFLRSGEPPKAFVEGFEQGLRELGYSTGRNLVIEYRFTDGSMQSLPRLASELVAQKVDVVVASAGPAALALQGATRSVPVVIVAVPDPVALGIVPSLARGDGNVTGLAISSADLAGKRLQLLKEVVPTLTRVAVLWEPANPTNQVQIKGVEEGMRAFGLQSQLVPVRVPDDFESAFKVASNASGLLVLDSVFFVTHRERIARLANANGLATIYTLKEFVDAGGLLSYGAHLPDMYRRAASYVDKILKGSKPSDLPIEQPAKFELVVNLKTARTLGITIPRSVMLRADELIR